MSESNVKVSKKALSGLKSNLLQLSGTLHEIYDLMNRDLSDISSEWRDGKYDEYRDAYSQDIKKCDEIANAYEEWCKGVIDPLTESVETITGTQVTPNGGGSSSGGGGAAAGAGAAGAAGGAASSAKQSKMRGFNTGKKVSSTHQSSADKKKAATVEPTAKPKKKKFETDGALEEADNLCRHLEGSEHSQAISAKDPNAKNVKMMEFNVSNAGSEWNAGGEVDAKAAKVIKNVVDIEGKIQGEYHSGKKSSNVTFKVPFDCSTPGKEDN